MTDWDERIAEALDEAPERPEPDVPPTPEIPLPPLQVAVVGSTRWDEPLVVQATLLGWAQHHQDRNVILWTTGAPDGAEEAAREWAGRAGWSIAEATPAQMIERDATVTFAFVLPGTDAMILAANIGHRRPLRMVTLETLEPDTPWNRW